MAVRSGWSLAFLPPNPQGGFKSSGGKAAYLSLVPSPALQTKRYVKRIKADYMHLIEGGG